jgi:hypothetical protein
MARKPISFIFDDIETEQRVFKEEREAFVELFTLANLNGFSRLEEKLDRLLEMIAKTNSQKPKPPSLP